MKNLLHHSLSKVMLVALTLNFVYSVKTNAQCFTPVTFAAPSNQPIGGYIVASNPHMITYGDFNGDGFMDLATANQSAANVNVYLNNGSGGFTQAPGSPAAINAASYCITTGDFNGDGKLDIVTSSTGNTVEILIGNGDGSFAAPLTYAIPSGSGTNSVSTGDYNHDGKTDILIGIGAGVQVLFGNGDGTFQFSNISTYPFPTTASGTIGVSNGADLNGDGNLDYAFAMSSTTNIVVMLGNSTGGFGNSLVLTPTQGTGSQQMLGVTMADFNGDGNMDIAATNRAFNVVDVWLGNGSGGFGVDHEFATLPSTGTSGNLGDYIPVAGDFNGDGFIDLAITGTTASNNAVFLLLGDGTGNFTPYNYYSLGGSQVSPQGMVAVDLNGDGRLDLATANGCPGACGSNNTISVLLNTTSTTTATASTPVCSGNTISLFGSGPSGTTGYKWTGPNGFSSTSQNPTISSATSVKAGVYTLVTTGVAGCTGHVSTVAVVVTSASASASSTNVCSGSLTLTGGPSSMKTYSWTGPGGFTSSSQNVTITSPTVALSTAYSLTVKDVNGCVSSANTAAVSVYGTGTVVGTNAQCPSASGVVFSTPSIAGATSYVWTVPSGVTINTGSTSNSISTTFPASLTPGNVTVAGIFPGCGTGKVASLVGVGLNPIPTLSGNQTINCIGGTTYFGGMTVGTGGTLTHSNGFTIHTFLTTGTFNPGSSGTIQYVVVAGGGGGGSLGGGNAGGGGAGGYRSSVAGEMSGGGASAESPLSVTGGTPLTVTVGTGGGSAANGGNSVLGSITSIGGGAGGTLTNVSGSAGGSGGGGGQTGTSDVGGAGTGGQGYWGGAEGQNYIGGASGGGAGSPGMSPFGIAFGSGVNVGVNGGNGGAGIESFITGAGYWLAGGGGGSSHGAGTVGRPLASDSGIGGGGLGYYYIGGKVYGSGPAISATSARANTGGGGGGGGESTGITGSGGSGVVIVRYADLTGGTWSSSNSLIASVDNTGLVTAVASGTATISFNMPSGPNVPCPYTITRTVTVSAGNAVTATAPATVCTTGTNNTLSLTASPSGLASYSWTGPNSFTSSLQNPVITFPTAAAAGIYTLTGSSGVGCSATSLSGSVAISAPAAATVNAQSICPGSSYTIASKTFTLSGNYLTKTAGTPGVSCDVNTVTKLKVLYGNGTASFNTVSLLTGLTNTSSPRAVISADINGDGKLDIASTDYSDGKVQIFLGNGAGGFTLASTTPTSPSGYSNSPTAQAIAAADLNGDGRADIIVGNWNFSNLNVFLGNADGTLTPTNTGTPPLSGTPIVIPGGVQVTAIATGDFNGDGKIDLAVANQTNAFIAILLGNGNGTFADPVTYANGSATGTQSIIAGDFNNDGNLDLATANSGTSTVSIFLGNGSGTFNSVTSVSTGAGTGPYWLITNDFNGDGFPDIATANNSNSTVSILTGNGTGGFTLSSSPSSGASTTPDFITSGDFDGDGIVDIATANPGNGTVGYIPGSAVTPGTFGAAVTIYSVSGSSPQGITMGDFNNDGRPDIVAATTALTPKAVTVLMNTGGIANPAYCGSLTLTGLPNGMNNYAWSGPSGFNSAIQSPVVGSPVSGIYSLTVTPSASSTCSNTATVNVVIGSNAATASYVSPACTNAPFYLTGGASGMKTYSWSGPSSFTSSIQNPIVATPPAASTYTYTLTTVDANGCSSTANTVVTVNQAATITPTTASGCFSTGNQSVNMTYSIGTGTPTLYSLDIVGSGAALFTPVNNATLTNPISISVPAGEPAATYTGILSVKTAAGCITTNASANIIIINPAPVLATTVNGVSAGGGSSCSGSNISLGVSGATGTYAWSPATYLTATSGTSVTVSGPTTSLTYTVTGTNTTGGCTASATIPIVYSNGLAGTYAIDNTISNPANLYPNANNFNSFTSAVAALSCISGAVTFNVKAGETFAEPPVVCSITNANNYAIIFQRSGAGANPVLMGTNGVVATQSSTVGDAIFRINNGNNITFNGIDLKDNAANTTPTLQMEYGLWINGGTGATTAIPGCSNITYENANITLNPANTNLTYGIYMQSNATVATGANSNNSFLNNTITGSAYGIRLIGLIAAYDQNNIISGNTITALGNGTPANLFRGIDYNAEQSLTISNNTISNSTNISTGVAFGIVSGNATGTSTATNASTANIFGNTITGLTGNNSGTITGILIGLSTSTPTAAVAGSANIYSNVISNFYQDNSGALIGIQYMPVAGINNVIHDNIISSLTATNSAAVEGIAMSPSSGTDIVSVYNNTLSSLSAYTGAVYGIYNQSGNATDAINIYNNSITGLASNVFTSVATTTIGINYASTGTGSIYGNTISSITTGSIATSSTGAGSLYGISISSGSVTNLYKNVVTGVTATATGSLAVTPVAGITFLNSTAAANIYANTVSNITNNSVSSTVQVTGIIVSGTAANNTINTYDNIINNISNASANTGTAVGLQNASTSTGTTNTFNNMIYDIRGNSSIATTNGGGAVGLYSSTTSGTQKIFYNTVYLNGVATGSVNQISTAFYSAIGGTQAFENNIWVNAYTPTSGATSVAYAQWFSSATITSVTLTNNLLYAGATSGTHNFLFFNGTQFQALNTGTTGTGGYQGAVAGKGDNTLSHTLTVSLASFFVSSVSPYNVHLNATPPTDAYQQGTTNLGAPWTQDIDGDLRAASGNTTIGADEPATLCSFTPPTLTVPSPVCQGSSNQVISVVTPVSGVQYNWSVPSSLTIVGAATNSSITVTVPTAAPASTYIVSVTESNGCTTSPAGTGSIVVNATVTTAGTISGPPVLCNGTTTGLVYSTTVIPNASSYVWTVPTGVVITSASNGSNITVTSTSPSAGNFTVAGINACGATSTSTATFAVGLNTILAAPASVTGLAIVCASATNVQYSASAVTGATSYQWTVPAGLGTISGSSTGTSILVNMLASPAPGNISVTAVNTCTTPGNAAAEAVVIASGVPALSGPQTLTCVGSQTTLAPFSATGGNITTVNGYRYHTYTTAGSSVFTANMAGNVEILVVAGGGSGGDGDAGGGGAGGLIYNSSFAVPNTAVTVTVGAGGAASLASSASNGNTGGQSVFSTITAAGGGYGGGTGAGGAGGSGGGGGYNAGANSGGAATPAGQGNVGGTGGVGTTANLPQGGGGGAGAPGTGVSGNGTGNDNFGHPGGIGLQYAQFAPVGGSPAGWFAGGGGGSGSQQAVTNGFPNCWGAGGIGGGGAGVVSSTAVSGTPNTGGGGGGTHANGSGTSGAGGSGIVIVRYPDYSGGTWTSSNSLIASVNSSTGVVTANAIGGPVTMTYAWSPASGGCSFSATQTVTVIPLTVTATASPNPVCTSGTLTLTGSPSGASSYSWSGPNGYSSTLQNPPAFTPTTAAAGTYTLTVISGICNQNNNTGAVVVTPTVTTTGTITGSTTVCNGQSGLVYSTSIPGAATYNWTVPSSLGTISGSSTGSSIIVNIAASPVAGSISVAGVSANSCGTGPSSSITVAPGVAPSISGSHTITCLGSTTPLTVANTAAVTGASAYSVTPSGNYTIYSFTTTGTTTGVSTGTSTATTNYTFTPNFSGSVDFLVIGGGGAGGFPTVNLGGNCGGGGAGGYRCSVSGESSGHNASPESQYAVAAGTGISVIVGGGGNYTLSVNNGISTSIGNGNSSTFGTIVSNGGGYGGYYNGTNGQVVGSNGGSGGGGAQTGSVGGSGQATQGFNGGTSQVAGTAAAYGGGGGGGAGGLGADSYATTPGVPGSNGITGGNGGIGIGSAITGTLVYRAGGGGGSSHNSSTVGAATAGLGGGGDASKNYYGGGRGQYKSSPVTFAVSGTDGTGSGGGGNGENDNLTINGGSGIVIIRVPNPTGGTWASDNTPVATVDNSGNVTGVSPGVANITYSYTPSGATCSLTSTNYAITVTSSVTPVITASANPACTTGGATLAATPTGAGITYAWQGPGGYNIAAGTNNATVTLPNPTNAGTYTVTVVNGACSASVTTVLAVSPPVGTNTGTISGPAVVCTSSGTVVYSTTTITNALSYAWTVPSSIGTISGASNGQSISVTVSGTAITGTTGNITVAGVSAGPCSNGTIASYTVGVNTTLAASSGITTTNGSIICSSETGIVYSAGAIPNATSYQWTVPSSVGTIVGTSTNNSITVTTPVSPTGGTITVAGKNVCGTVSSNTVSFTASGPTPPVISGTQTLTCIGTTSQLTATAGVVAATGGSVSVAGGYAIHTFSATGTTTSTYTFTPSVNMTVDYLVIAGGASGGPVNDGEGGGGGAGGYRTSVAGDTSGALAAAEPSLNLTAGTPYTVTVGGGGQGGIYNFFGGTATNGANSSIVGSSVNITSTGGGIGGTWDGGSGTGGGSGGGGGQTGGAGGAGTTGQGFAGSGSVGDRGAGGGGGAGGLGHVNYNTGAETLDPEGGQGGRGLVSHITGSAVTRGGGGGGSSHPFGTLGVPGGASVGGTGGGGNGHYYVNGVGPIVAATNGVDGTGGGGGGSGESGDTQGNGGSGIVIMRYQSPAVGTWTSSNTTVATVNGSTGLVTAQGNGTSNITFTYTPANSNCPLSSSYAITVTAQTASAGATTPVCTSGSNSSLNLTATTNAGAPSYLWKGPNGFTSTVQNPVILPISLPAPLSTASAGIYTLTVTDATCGTGKTTTTGNVVVNPTVTAQGSITGTHIVCSNSTGIVYSTAPIANAVAYTWTIPSTATIVGSSTNNAITVNYSSAASGNFTVLGVSAGGCDPGPVTTYSITVNSALPATAGMTSPNGGASVCPAQTGLIYSAVAIPEAASYAWTVPSTLGTIVGTSTGNTITVTINGVGLATSGNITVAGVNLCGSTSNNSISFAVSVPPTAVTGNTTITCLQGTTQLTAPPSAGATGGTITTAGGFTIHTFTSSGTFTPLSNFNVNYLVVGGGAAGGVSTPGMSGGGGAGGVITSVPGDFSGGGAAASSPLAVTSGTPIVVTIGAGGLTANSISNGVATLAGNGNQSSFGSIIAYGGGSGGQWQGNLNAASAGGSGGGAAQAGSLVTVGAGTAGQGYAGAQITPGSGACGAGGGGGAGAPGHVNTVLGSIVAVTGGVPVEGGPGGAGVVSNIVPGSPVTYGGGGGGASHDQGTVGVPGGACVGGAGGGGNGRYNTGGTGPIVNATNGAPNTGGGGGGGGSNTDLTGSPAPGNGGSGIVIVRYTTPAVGVWSSDNTVIATVNSSGLVTGIAVGTCNILYTVSTGTCPYVNSTAITVAPVVTPNITVNPPTCIGGTLSLTGSAANGSATYAWKGPNSFTSTIQSPTISSLTTAANGVYTLTVTAGSCTESTISSAVVVNSNPVPSITEADNSGTANNDHIICNLDPVTLGVASFSGYSWSPGSATTQSITVNPSISTTYTITVTDGNGCTTATSSAVTVKALPPVVVSPPSAVCLPVTNIALTASGASTYIWAPTANLTPSAGTTATETAQISLLTFYTVTGTDGNLCSQSVIVPVATVATGGIISPNFSIICSGNTKTLTVTGAAGHDYQWQISADDVIWTNITGATNITYTTASVDGNTNKFYRLMAQSNSCWNVASTTAEVDVSVPVINVTASNITSNSVTLSWNSPGTGNYIVSWSGPSFGTSTSVTPPKTLTGLTANGNYSITVTQSGVTGGCSASGTIAISTLCAQPTGVTASSPANSQLLVSWTGPAGNYRVYYRPLYSYNTYFTKDVTNANSVLLTKQGNNNLYGSTTYEIYVSRLDCPTTGATGQGSTIIYATTLPSVSCATPSIDSVKSTCPIQIEIWLHPGSSPTNNYNVYIQRLTPTILAVNSYGVSGNYFTVSVPYSGDTYLISAEAKCAGGGLSNLVIYPGDITIKPQCTAPANLVLSNPTCHGFTASWNADQCLSNTVSGYDLYLRVLGTLNYNSYGVPLPGNGIGPNKQIGFVTSGRTYQVFVQSIYNCNGFASYGPSSLVQTITTLSSGCRDEDEQQPEETKPAAQQYSADNQEVFSLYPNPNNGEFVVDLSRYGTEEDAVRIEVINMIGQTVMTHLTTISGGQMREFINLPNGTAAGTYIVRLTAGKNVYTARVNVSK